jgi:cytochrome c biogenesis protein CcdA
MATNIAAISYVSRDISKRRVVLMTGLLYTLGRMILYVSLGALLAIFLLSVPRISFFLQKYMNIILGPILLLVGLVLLEFIKFNISGSWINGVMQKRAKYFGMWGALLLGFIFALSFCPISAALFFGSLLPLSVKFDSIVMIPAFYGIGTGLPVILFAILIAFGFQTVGKTFNKLAVLEKWVRRSTGIIFIMIGIYFSLVYIFHVPL